MGWIAGIVVGVVALAVLGAVFFGGKSRDDRPVPGRFDFDGYKERELSQRGLFDKTKWR
jgi:hypothetical protein